MQPQFSFQETRAKNGPLKIMLLKVSGLIRGTFYLVEKEISGVLIYVYVYDSESNVFVNSYLRSLKSHRHELIKINF